MLLQVYLEVIIEDACVMLSVVFGIIMLWYVVINVDVDSHLEVC